MFTIHIYSYCNEIDVFPFVQKSPNIAVLITSTVINICEILVLSQVGHLGYNIKTNIKFITKLTSVPIK